MIDKQEMFEYIRDNLRLMIIEDSQYDDPELILALNNPGQENQFSILSIITMNKDKVFQRK